MLQPEQVAPWWDRTDRLGLAFGPHPRSLLLAGGRALLRAHIPGPGLGCGRLTLLHERPAGDAFAAIALVDGVRLLSSLFPLN